MEIRASGRCCHYCYTGLTGCADVGPDPILVVSILREGPYAVPSHPICTQCYQTNRHMQRYRCQNCGKLAALLFTANASMTNKWSDVGHTLLCDECCKSCYDGRKWTIDLAHPNYTRSVPLTEKDIKILMTCWKLPGWKTMLIMPKCVCNMKVYLFGNGCECGLSKVEDYHE